MKKIIFPLAFLVITLISCKKDKVVDDPVVPEIKTSVWYIDGEKYSSTQVTKGKTDHRWFALSNSGSNGYDSAFYISVLIGDHNINNDSFSVYGPRTTVSPVSISINGHQGSYVVMDSGTYLYTISINGKIKFTLPPTYVRKIILDTVSGMGVPEDDSKVIQGEFYEP